MHVKYQKVVDKYVVMTHECEMWILDCNRKYAMMRNGARMMRTSEWCATTRMQEERCEIHSHLQAKMIHDSSYLCRTIPCRFPLCLFLSPYCCCSHHWTRSHRPSPHHRRRRCYRRRFSRRPSDDCRSRRNSLYYSLFVCQRRCCNSTPRELRQIAIH